MTKPARNTLLARLFGSNVPDRPPTPSRGKPGAQYMRGERSDVFGGWHPVLRDAREDVRAAYWRASARTIDQAQNSGWIAGVIIRGKATILGTGLKLALKPDFEEIGWTQAKSAKWARKVERKWESWACNALECDAEGVWNIHEQASAALGSFYASGEWVAEYPFISRGCSKTRTKVRLIPAYRLTQETNGHDLFQGVRVDRHGLPLSYRFRLTQPIMDPGDVIEIQARDSANRPRVVHRYEGDISQMRGISPFTPALEKMRQYDELSGATLAAQTLQALYAATITSPSPTSDVLTALQSDQEQDTDHATAPIEGYFNAAHRWYEKAKINLRGLVRLTHLFPGEKLEFTTPKTPNDNYEAQSNFLLREFAMCAGFTYEDVTGDYNKATYSSIRMSSTTNWPIQIWRRKHIVAPFYQAAFECWLEEQIELGQIEFPGGVGGFVKLRSEATRAEWRGSAKPQADDLKWANSVKVLKQLGVLTDEHICAEMGLNVDDVYEQLAREKQTRKRLKLPEVVVAGSTVADSDELAGEGGKTGQDGQESDKGGQDQQNAPPGAPAKKKPGKKDKGQ